MESCNSITTRTAVRLGRKRGNSLFHEKVLTQPPWHASQKWAGGCQSMTVMVSCSVLSESCHALDAHLLWASQNYFTMYLLDIHNNVSSVVEFQRWWVLKRVENQLWKYNFGTFQRTHIPHKVQWFPLSNEYVDFWPKILHFWLKILLFKTHHLRNLTTQLILAYIHGSIFIFLKRLMNSW